MWKRFLTSKTALYVSASVFAALVVIGGIMVITRPEELGTASRTSVLQPDTLPSRSITNGCPATHQSSDLLTVLADVTWEPVPGGFQLPYSATAGPCQITATVASDYAHSPAGAVLAGAHLLVRSMTTAPVTIAESTIGRQFVSGTDRDKLLANARALAGETISPDALGRIRAFSVVSFTPDTAVISLAETADVLHGQYVTLSLVLRWVDGDWQMVAPAGGTWASVSRLATVLDGYTAWGP